MNEAITLSQALLTPVIALITVYIAYQQYRIRRDECALQLYDRRLALFNKMIEIIDRIRAGHELVPHEAFAWLGTVNEAQFIFGKEVDSIIQPLFTDVFEYADSCESNGALNIESSSAALRTEAYRTPLIEAMRFYLRAPGAPVRKSRRLSIKEVEKTIRVGMADGNLPNERPTEDIPF